MTPVIVGRHSMKKRPVKMMRRKRAASACRVPVAPIQPRKVRTNSCPTSAMGSAKMSTSSPVCSRAWSAWRRSPAPTARATSAIPPAERPIMGLISTTRSVVPTATAASAVPPRRLNHQVCTRALMEKTAISPVQGKASRSRCPAREPAVRSRRARCLS
jgi:hypothetical protein